MTNVPNQKSPPTKDLGEWGAGRRAGRGVRNTGWSSAGGSTIDHCPELKALTDAEDVSEISLSAFFELLDSGSDELTVREVRTLRGRSGAFPPSL